MEAATYCLLIVNGIIVGVCAGFVMHRSDFCLAGMFRDLFLFRQTDMLRFLLLAILLSSLLFEAARLAGMLHSYPFPLLGPPSLTNVIGGALFGIGMVLAGGCVVGTLYKLGAGSAVSLAAFAGLIIGSTAYAEIHSFWAAFRNATTFGTSITLPQKIGIAPLPLVLVMFALCWYFCYDWNRAGKLVRRSAAVGYLQPGKAALLLACIGLWSWVVTGTPLGITTAYAKLGGYIESWFLWDHVRGLQFYSAPPLHYVNPLTSVELNWSPGPWFDAVSVIQFPLIAGIVGGGALSTLMLREFRIYFRVPFRQYLSAIIGGIIMGLASRMAPGCNIWHLCGGLPVFAWQSMLFLAGLLAGAWLGSLLLRSVVLK